MRGPSMLGLVLLVAATVGCSSAGSSEANAPPPVLEGVYQGEANGSFAWAGLRGSDYVLWSADPACNEPATSPAASCLETGTFALEAANNLLHLTDAKTGQTRSLHIKIAGTQARDSLVGQAWHGGSLAPEGAGIVGSQQLVAPGSQLVAKQFAVYNPSDAPLVQQVDLRSTTFALLQVCAILLGNPAGNKIEQPAPPPIVQTIGCGKK